LSTKIYRVRREFSLTYGKPYAALDFEVFNEADQRFVSLTDKTIRATQIKIEESIGLDFETFINTAFIKQGQSNEFSKKTPKERKQILANILGLSKYDVLQQLALETVKKNTDDKKLIVQLIEQSNEELGKRNETEKNLLEQKLLLQQTHTDLEKLTTQQVILEHERSTFNQVKNHYEFINKQIVERQHGMTLKQTELRALRKNWKIVHAQSLTLPDIVELEAQSKRFADEEKKHLVNKQAFLILQETILHKKEDYQKVHTLLIQKHEKMLNALERETDKLQLNVTNGEQQLKKYQQEWTQTSKQQQEVIKELELINNELKQKEVFDTAIEYKKKQFEKRRDFYQALVQRGNFMKSHLRDLEHKRSVTDDTTNPSCPLCEQVLTLKRKQFLAKTLEKQAILCHHQLKRAATILVKLKALLVEQHKEIQTGAQQAERYAHLQLKYNDLIKKKSEYAVTLDALTNNLGKLNQEYEQLKKLLNERITSSKNHQEASKKAAGNDGELKKLHQELLQLEAQKLLISFDPKAYDVLQIQIKELEKNLQKITTIKEENAKQAQRKRTLQAVIQDLRRDHAWIKIQQDTALKLNFKPEDETAIAKKQEVLKQESMVISQRKEIILQTTGRLENELQRMDKLKEQQKEHKRALVKIEDEIELYQVLANTFSKNGIQALLIEEAIPEIEQEANDIVGRLTNNQSQIFIESLRDLKRGGVKETLDIKIADPLGIRPYEMYSGGEAFRIDFALRIAISKLLARRAGTALQTLIIDEGFGSQDDEGLARLMAAIHSIQHDFSKIIIVSHLAEFKDNFPVHFLVEKGPAGSTIKVEERG
jgi:exonuclease SbcC